MTMGYDSVIEKCVSILNSKLTQFLLEVGAENEIVDNEEINKSHGSNLHRV